jgi:hypothetical protein
VVLEHEDQKKNLSNEENICSPSHCWHAQMKKRVKEKKEGNSPQLVHYLQSLAM